MFAAVYQYRGAHMYIFLKPYSLRIYNSDQLHSLLAPLSLRESKAVFLNGQAARGSPGSCHFRFLSIFHKQIFYSGNILRRIIFVNVSKSSFH
jgi:hypothetical protein